MGIAEDLPILESRLTELITRYEQYFIGLEKREPLKLLADVEQLASRYANVPITNTMYRHRYTNLIARLSSYQQLWSKTVREIEEGRYSRDRFRARLREGQQESRRGAGQPGQPTPPDPELERVYQELLEARKKCTSRSPPSPVNNWPPPWPGSVLNSVRNLALTISASGW